MSATLVLTRLDWNDAMDADLRAIWDDINVEHFSGVLTPPSDIDWYPLTGEEGIEAFGVYFHRINAIAIDERFKFDADAIRADGAAANARLEVAYRLVLHEMVHQAQYQKQLPLPGSHGPSFVAEATRIAAKLGVPPPAEATARRWPELAVLLAHHGI